MPAHDDASKDSWFDHVSSIVTVIVAVVGTVVTAVLANLATTNSGAAPARTDFTVPVPATIAFAVAVGLIVAYAFYRNVAAARRASDAQERADRALKDVSSPDDLLGFVRANASQMHAYDLLARRQAAQSHRASIVSMFVGLALVSAGVAVAVLAPDSVSKVAGAGVTAVGAAVGGYIAKTFLTNSRRAAQTAAFYFRQPLVTSYLLTAERLAASLPEAAQGPARVTILEAAITASIAAQSASLSLPGQDSPAAAVPRLE